MPSMRSAAELNAPVTASDAAFARSAATRRASCKAATSSSSRRTFCIASLSSSATIKAAITVRRVSPISPNLRRRSMMRWSTSFASDCRCSSWPSSQARRNWRPAMVATIWAINSLVQIHHQLDRCNRIVETLGDFAVRCLQPPRARGFAIQCRGESCAIDAESLHLSGKALFTAVSLLSPFNCGIERVEREGQTLDGRIDCALLRHALLRIKKSCGGRYLGQELYVLRNSTVNAWQTICPAVFVTCE